MVDFNLLLKNIFMSLSIFNAELSWIIIELLFISEGQSNSENISSELQ